MYGSISKQKMKIKLVQDLNPSVENCFPYTSHIYLFLVLGVKVTIRIIRMIATFLRLLISLLQQKDYYVCRED
jgi:hypothetical protein